MSKLDYRTFWKRDDPITAEWLERTSRWLEGMNSSDGSILVTHNDGGINLQVGGITDGRAGGGIVSTSATPYDLDPSSILRDNNVYCTMYRPRIATAASGRIIQGAATPQSMATFFRVDPSSDELEPTFVLSSGNVVQTKIKKPRLSITGHPPIMRVTSATLGALSTAFTISTSTVDLMPESRVYGLSLQHRQKLIKLTISGNPPTIYLAAAATYSDWVNGASLCSATEA